MDTGSHFEYITVVKALHTLACAALYCIASAGICRAQTALDVTPTQASPQAATDALRALCNPAVARATPLPDTDATACRQLFQDDIGAARIRQQAYQQQAIDAFARRRDRQHVAGPVPLETFVGDDTLIFGDIVMLDDGPRVYVGKAFEPAKAADFLRLDAPGSPHRKRAAEMLRTLKR